MGQLSRRARTPEHKEERRAAILETAAQLCATQPLAALTMAQVAEAVGLSKAALYLYYRTREELLLALLETQLFDWFMALQSELSRALQGVAPPKLARLMVRSLDERIVLVRLLTVLETLLEQNIPLDAVQRFKGALHAALLTAGAQLERLLPNLRRGAGARVLLQIRALMVGLWQMADASPVAREVIRQGKVPLFDIQFGAELTHAITALLVGHTHVAAQEVRHVR